MPTSSFEPPDGQQPPTPTPPSEPDRPGATPAEPATATEPAAPTEPATPAQSAAPAQPAAAAKSAALVKSAAPAQPEGEEPAAPEQPNGATSPTSWKPPQQPPAPRPPQPGQPPQARQPHGSVATMAPPPAYPPPQQLGTNPAVISPVRIGPPDPNMFQRRWPQRSTAAGPDVLIGALIVAVVAAAALPLDRAGLGWPIAGLALVAALLVVILRVEPKQRGTSAIEATCWSVATVALLSVGVFRAAGWLFVLCVLAAFGTVALAVGAGRRVPAIFMAVLNVPLAGLRAVPWIARGLARARVAEGASGATRVIGSIALGVLLLIVFGALFASADAAFDRIVQAILPEISPATPFRWLFVGSVFAFLTVSGAYLLHNPSTIGDGKPREVRAVRWYEWVIPVGAVLVVFGVFVGVQLAVLFGDWDYVMRTTGLTFADYARKGFWQLLVVTLLTLVVIAVTVRKAARDTFRERLLLRVLLGLLSAGALVVVISALWRMDVYEQAYGFTRLRVLVSAFELWLGGIIVLIMVAGVVPATRWLPRTAVALWVITLLGLAVLNPDRFIAEQNVARYATHNNSDIWYLSTLSADAAPALAKLPAGARACALSEISRDVHTDDDWRGWNLGRAEARRIVPEQVDSGSFPCYRTYR